MWHGAGKGMRSTECRLVRPTTALTGVKLTGIFLPPSPLVSRHWRHIIESFGCDVRWDLYYGRQLLIARATRWSTDLSHSVRRRLEKHGITKPSLRNLQYRQISRLLSARPNVHVRIFSQTSIHPGWEITVGSRNPPRVIGTSDWLIWLLGESATRVQYVSIPRRCERLQ